MNNYWLLLNETLHTEVIDYLASPSDYAGSIPVDDLRGFVAGWGFN